MQVSQKSKSHASNITKLPICSKPVTPSERYACYDCSECKSKAQSKVGRLLIFFKESMSGGFAAQYADTGEPYSSHECYIDRVLCHADEARFGGIVIQPV